MAHGSDENIDRAARIALCAHAAISGLDGDRSKLYCDLVIHSLSEAARNALRNMDARAYEYQSDFARQYVAQGRAEGKEEGKEEGRAVGRAEGEASGRAALIARQLTLRFGPLGATERSRILAASIAELDAMGERLLISQTLDEVLGIT
jgi:flagellar biosynthesis/type III secretory pathway protein FliH